MSLPDPLKPYRRYLLMFVLNLAIVAGVIYLLRRPEPHKLTVIPPPPPGAGTSAVKQALTPITVYLDGAVNHPGALQLDGDARLADALQKAGLKHEADVSTLDLTLALHDGDQVIVPARAPAPVTNNLASPTTAPAAQNLPPASAGKLNLNTATLAELDALPGIGPALAQRILDYRAQHGGFKSIDEIKNVRGIGDTLFDELEERITVQ